MPSWKAWLSDKKVRQRSAGPDDWNHPAATWEQAFARSYKVVNYLLGKPPLAMKLTVLLLPEGVTYSKVFDQTGADFAPLTFAFYYPSSSSQTDMLTGARFAALVESVSRSVYEYQHLMDETGAIKSIGKNETDEVINDESRSHCWFDSVYLALTSGTHTEASWNPAPQGLLEASSGHSTSLATENHAAGGESADRRFPDAVLWARYLEAQSISAYLRERGLKEAKVISNEPASMNHVLSVCRAMTQQPIDLTAGPYPASKVEYVPFFPDKIGQQKSKAESDGN